jgi:hypothetical protein
VYVYVVDRVVQAGTRTHAALIAPAHTTDGRTPAAGRIRWSIARVLRLGEARIDRGGYSSVPVGGRVLYATVTPGTHGPHGHTDDRGCGSVWSRTPRAASSSVCGNEEIEPNIKC